MSSSSTRSGRANAFAPLLLAVAGVLGVILSANLTTDSSSLPSILVLPFLARFILTLVFVGIIALLFPLFALGLALLVMFGGSALLEYVRPLFPISPFWVLLTMSTGSLFLQNFRGKLALPWGIMGMMLVLIALTGMYEIGAEGPVHGMTIPLLGGLMAATATGMLRTARQLVVVAGALIVAFLALVLALLPYLIPTWETSRGVLRAMGGTTVLTTVTSLDWLLTSVALFCLGMAFQMTGKWKVALLGLFLVFATSDLLTFTRGSFIGLGAGLMALLPLSTGRRSRAIGLALLAGLALFLVANYSGAWTYNSARGLDQELRQIEAGEVNRLALLVEGTKQLPAHVFSGKGAMGPYHHSSFLDVWINYGAITAVTLWGFLLFLFRRSFRLAKAASRDEGEPRLRAISVGLYCSFAGAAAIALVDTSFFSLSFAVIFWLMRGLESAIARQMPRSTANLARRQLPDISGHGLPHPGLAQ